MRRQVYGVDPATGIVCHHYIDCGPGAAIPNHGATKASTAVPMASHLQRVSLERHGFTVKDR
jgi:hypothetical protein